MRSISATTWAPCGTGSPTSTTHDAFFCVVDLHAITIPQDPAELRAKTLAMATLLLAAGLDPEVCTLFVQSHVPEHSQLGWIMECTASVGELQRMMQFKDKSAKQAGFISAGLLTYPALQAADILLYDADRVPVGDDQRQHLELTRDVAIRFNSPLRRHVRGARPTPSRRAGARVMDLQDPTAQDVEVERVAPGHGAACSTRPRSIAAKFKRAVTDSGTEVALRPRHQARRVEPAVDPGGGDRRRRRRRPAAGITQYGPLKAAAATPSSRRCGRCRQRYAELSADPGEVTRLLAVGADKARAVAAKTLARAQHALGFLAPG